MEILLNTKSEFPPGVSLWQNQKSIIHLIPNFTTMRKSILILFMALFAVGMNTAYGQVPCPVPRTVDPVCLPSDALHVVPGTPYNYTVNVPTPPGTKSYTWFVTQDKNFIVNGVLTAAREPIGGLHVASAIPVVNYNNPPAAPTIQITWKGWAYDTLNPVFVVINVLNDAGGGGCISQNMKVYEIKPVNAFTLDIANVRLDQTIAGYETSIDRCIHDIYNATYDPTAPEGVLYDFGTDSLYYVVTAANFTTSWKPSLQVNVIDPLETIKKVEWARPNDFVFATPHPMPLTAGVYTSTDDVLALDPTGTVGPAGECILIRVTIDHTGASGNYQGLIDETVTVAVDGKTQLALPVPIGDVHWSSTLPVANTFCGLEDGFQFDLATQVIKARPDIQAVTPTPFLPVKP